MEISSAGLFTGLMLCCGSTKDGCHRMFNKKKLLRYLIVHSEVKILSCRRDSSSAMFLLTVMTANTILSSDKQTVEGSLPPLALITDLVCNRVVEQNFLFSQKVLESIRML